MDREAFQYHLTSNERFGLDRLGDSGAPVGSAGGAGCGDLVAVALTADAGRVVGARFTAEGCGSTRAAGSAAASLVEGMTVLDAARVGFAEIDAELGGVSLSKRHAVDLAVEALHRALTRTVLAAVKPLCPDHNRVVVGLSGGVDSAAAALLLREQGAEVVCVTLELWSDPAADTDKACCSPAAVLGARSLAHSLGLPHFSLDLRELFRVQVVDTYLAEHDAGRTPNPCVRCNGTVRFDEMLSFGERLGASRLATGHYARIGADEQGPLLYAASDPKKDQTYMLAAVEPDLLQRLVFPIGELRKPQVRELAERAGLAVAQKADSQDLCFMAGTAKQDFLKRHGGAISAPGEIVDSSGSVIGRHRGHQHYTVGQRKGLGVAAPRPRYVLSKDVQHNRVVVGSKEELETRRVRIAPGTLYRDSKRVTCAKLRYQSAAVPARIGSGQASGLHDELSIDLAEPIDGAAPGQVACLMDGQRVVGWGVIR